MFIVEMMVTGVCVCARTSLMSWKKKLIILDWSQNVFEILLVCEIPKYGRYWLSIRHESLGLEQSEFKSWGCLILWELLTFLFSFPFFSYKLVQVIFLSGRLNILIKHAKKWLAHSFLQTYLRPSQGKIQDSHDLDIDRIK